MYLFVLWLCVFSILSLVLFVRNAIFRFVFLNKLVIFRIVGLMKVKVVQSFGLLVCSLLVCSCNTFCWRCVLSLVIIDSRYPLVLAICSTSVHSFCLYWVARDNFCIIVSRNLKAASLCSYGWLEVK